MEIKITGTPNELKNLSLTVDGSMSKPNKKEPNKWLPKTKIRIDKESAIKSLKSFENKQSHSAEQNRIVIPDAKHRRQLKTLLEDYVPTYRNKHDPLTLLHELCHHLFLHHRH